MLVCVNVRNVNTDLELCVHTAYVMLLNRDATAS
jgi:hypothetical protein